MSEDAAWWQVHFFGPFSCLKAKVGPVYQLTVPPEQFGLGREFARQLWTCCDEEDLHHLVQDDSEGAAQFVFLASIRTFERLVPCARLRPGSPSIPHKPFAVLASTVLEWMDEIEVRNPGKTMRRR